MSKDAITIDDKFISLSLEIRVFEEEGLWYAESEALELLGYGESAEEAKASFQAVIKDYFEYTLENKTLEADLKKYGWIKHNGNYLPPGVSSDGKLLNDLPFELISQQVLIPCFK